MKERLIEGKDKVRITVRLLPELHAFLILSAKKKNKTVNLVVNEIIEEKKGNNG